MMSDIKPYTHDEKYRIDLLQKNLDHLSRSYSTLESIFPAWEAAFALITGQLFIAYFNNYGALGNTAISIMGYMWSTRGFLAILGIMLSFLWFIMVSLNLQHAPMLDKNLRIY